MTTRIRLLSWAVALLVPLAAVAQEKGCHQPDPVDVPQTAPADREGVLTVQETVKTYLADANAFLACTDGEMRKLANLKAAARKQAERDLLEERLQRMLERYNATVDHMHQIGDSYNNLLAEYKAQNPGN